MRLTTRQHDQARACAARQRCSRAGEAGAGVGARLVHAPRFVAGRQGPCRAGSRGRPGQRGRARARAQRGQLALLALGDAAQLRRRVYPASTPRAAASARGGERGPGPRACASARALHSWRCLLRPYAG